MRLFFLCTVSLPPCVMLVAALRARFLPAPAAARLAIAAATVALAAAVVSAGLLPAFGAVTARWSPLGPDAVAAVSVRFDLVAAVMTVLVAFLGRAVLVFSRNYLAGDPGQARFFGWMGLTLAAVLTLVVAGNLLLFFAAWLATSLCLHRLLLHYPERPGAVFSARKKFVISRLGDLCLVGALVLTVRAYGTWEFDALFAAAAAGHTAALPAIAAFLAGGAALKSAQFPFHSWLPDTMETPTPVSAFMHAGIVNAGGFLVIRLAPLFVHAPGALTLLAVFGTVTAAYGAVVMLAQPSVKRALAYSTVAQMGFMLLQCGLGAFALALLHIVAHSLYKAHAFLHAGSTVGATPRAARPLRTSALALGVLTGGLLVAGAATLLSVFVPPTESPVNVFTLILVLALGYGLARLWSVVPSGTVAMRALFAAGGIGLASLALHAGSRALFGHLPAPTPAPWVVAGATAVFVALFFFQSLLWRANAHPLGRALYVHALNGFYVGTVANRLLNRLWPRAGGR